jgi:hypothetical protein
VPAFAAHDHPHAARPSIGLQVDPVGGQRAVEVPAYFVAFDLLYLRGQDIRAEPLSSRGARLEDLMRGTPPPLQVSPATSDRRSSWSLLASTVTGTRRPGMRAASARTAAVRARA